MKFATAITCIDGRAHQPVVEYLKRTYSVDVVDLVTAPGVDGLLAVQGSNAHAEFLKAATGISVKAHHSGVIAVAGHHDCAGHPVDVQQHHRDITTSVRAVEAWGLNTNVIGLWVDETWTASVVGSAESPSAGA